MNIGVHVSFQDSVFVFFPDTYSGVKLLDHMIVLFLVFEEPAYCFPQWLHQFILPPIVYKGSLFSTFSPTFAICVLFDDSHSDRWGDISLWFEFAFLWWLTMLSIFSCACWTSVYLLWKNVYLAPWPIFLFFNLLMAVLGLCLCARAFSSCDKRGPLFIAVHGPLTIVASLVVEHRLQTRRLSNCGSRAQLLCGMWDLPRPGHKPVSPALAGRFSTTAPPGKPLAHFLLGCLCFNTELYELFIYLGY